MNLVRKPAVAGAFYPADPKEIKKVITDFSAKAKLPELPAGNPLGLIVPHAGYIYSGGVAAYSYNTITAPDKIDTVILLGPSHRAYFRGISVFPGGVYQTPLGDMRVDEEIAAELSAIDGVSYVKEAHAQEHSLEVQLPFLQTVFKDVKIVVAVLGAPDRSATDNFVDALTEIATRKNILIIASSDFSHYHNYNTAKKMDSSAFESILKMSDTELTRKNAAKSSELCGILPVEALLKVMNRLGAGDARMLHSANSGDVTGEKGPTSEVVGYAAVAFYHTEGAKKGASEGKELTLNEKKQLLKIAKDTVDGYIKSKKKPKLREIKNPNLLEKSGVFVTIKKDGRLRGCIGNFTSDKPLCDNIVDMAMSAATQDPRFPTVTASELDELKYEISVLTPMRRTRDVTEIEVGKHGIYIIQGYNRGVLLPQVATEYGWDSKTFLEQTCNKAGLGRDAWKDNDTEIYLFSAQVFSWDEVMGK